MDHEVDSVLEIDENMQLDMDFLKRSFDVMGSFLKNSFITSLLTLLLGYYLGKRDWKKQFLLKNFDLHEKVLKKLTSISDDEIEGYFFKETEKEIEKMIKNKKIMSAAEYFSEIKILRHLDSSGYPSSPAFSSIENIMGDLSYLSVRSNKKISNILTKILKVYSDNTKCLESDIESLSDFDPVEGVMSEEDCDYLNYFRREKEELILLKIVPLVNNLKKELNSYLKNKE
jgi:hypothetical protein